MDLGILLFLFALGFLVAIIGAIAASGDGIILLPTLIFLGLPPAGAVATNKVGAIGSNLSTIGVFLKNKKIIKSFILPLTIVSVIGSLIGANILIRIDQTVITKLVGATILLTIPLLFIKGIGLKRKKVGTGIMALGFLLYLLVGLYDGFLGPPSGILVMFVLVLFFGFTFIEANATFRIPWLVNLLVLVIFFGYHGLINYEYGIALFSGRFFGGYVGAKLAIKKGEKFVRLIIVVIGILFAIKLLFF